MQENSKHIEEDEIDLRELFKTIWDKKVFILVFTFVITVLAGIYAYSKTPIYEAKAVVRIGYISGTLVEPSNIIEQKLRLIFDVDNNRKYEFIENGVVSDISAIKKVENFLELKTEATSSEKALEKNKEVLAFLQNEYKFKIDEFITKTEISIKNIENNIKYAQEVEKTDLVQNIERIKIQKIPRIDREIELLKVVDLKSIENRLEFNNQKLKEYEAESIRISKQKMGDNSQNMLMAMQLLNTQNLILNIQNTIENLVKEKENLLNLRLKDLEESKENIVKDTLRKAEVELDINFVKRLESLNDSLSLEKLKLTNNSVKNSEIVGEIVSNDHPIKPKKSLIVVVAFVTGFILSIFLVFFLQFIQTMRKES